MHEQSFSGGTAGVWRAIDASANRAAEAIRVVEDVVRFTLDDVTLTALAKEMRHELAALLASESLRDESRSGPPHGLLDALRRLFKLEE